MLLGLLGFRDVPVEASPGPGLPREEGRCVLEDVALLLQALDAPSELAELLALGAGQPARSARICPQSRLFPHDKRRDRLARPHGRRRRVARHSGANAVIASTRMQASRLRPLWSTARSTVRRGQREDLV